jgi:membrane fusion protein YbhG
VKKIIPVVLVIAVVAGLLWWHPWKKEDSNRILLSGNIETTEVDIAFKVPGRLIERAVDEGDSVKKDQVVARLDREQLLQQRAQAEAAIAVAEAQLAQSQTAVGYQRESVAADIQARLADLGTSRARLAELKNGSRPEEVREAEAAVQSAQAELDRARKDFARAETLHKADDISTQQLDQARQRMIAAQSQLQAAEQRQALVRQGPRVEQVEQAASNVERANAAIRMSQANQIEVKRREQEVAARRAEVLRLKAQLAQLDVQLNETVAASPVGGVVLVKSADPGEVLAAGTTIMTIGDIDRPWLRGYIGERDLGRVKLGMNAKVTTDSYPGKVYNGKLTFISSQAEFTPRQIQTQEERVKLVYRVKIDIDNRNHELKSNMPVDAEILLEQ